MTAAVMTMAMAMDPAEASVDSDRTVDLTSDAECDDTCSDVCIYDSDTDGDDDDLEILEVVRSDLVWARRPTFAAQTCLSCGRPLEYELSFYEHKTRAPVATLRVAHIVRSRMGPHNMIMLRWANDMRCATAFTYAYSAPCEGHHCCGWFYHAMDAFEEHHYPAAVEPLKRALADAPTGGY